MDRIFRAAAEIFMHSPALMKHLFHNFPDCTIDIETLRAAAREIFMNRLMTSISCLLSNKRQDPKSKGRLTRLLETLEDDPKDNLKIGLCEAILRYEIYPGIVEAPKDKVVRSLVAGVGGGPATEIMKIVSPYVLQIRAYDVVQEILYVARRKEQDSLRASVVGLISGYEDNLNRGPNWTEQMGRNQMQQN